MYSEDFIDRRLEGIEVNQDTVFNIALDSGALLEGKVVDEVGQPVSDALVCAHLSTEPLWTNPLCSETNSVGGFEFQVASGAGYIVTIQPVAPLRPTQLRLEVSGDGVTDLVLTVSQDPMPFVPDDPPKAALISISAPTAESEVTLNGAAGSVAPHSTVVAITVETGHVATAQATDRGSFRAALFAPAGTSILIKADPVGTAVAQFLSLEADANTKPAVLAGLPGTILRVAAPPGGGIPIGGAGRSHWDTLPAWTFQGSLTARTFAPGDPLRVRGTVRVASPVLQGVDGTPGKCKPQA